VTAFFSLFSSRSTLLLSNVNLIEEEEEEEEEEGDEVLWIVDRVGLIGHDVMNSLISFKFFSTRAEDCR
jgi:hypothetical protein